MRGVFFFFSVSMTNLLLKMFSFARLCNSWCVFLPSTAGAHPSADPGDANQAVLPPSLGQECHVSAGLGAHGHHQGNHRPP